MDTSHLADASPGFRPPHFQRGYAKQQIIELFRLIDWMMRLTDALEREFLGEHYAFEEAQHMPCESELRKAKEC